MSNKQGSVTTIFTEPPAGDAASSSAVSTSQDQKKETQGPGEKLGEGDTNDSRNKRPRDPLVLGEDHRNPLGRQEPTKLSQKAYNNDGDEGESGAGEVSAEDQKKEDDMMNSGGVQGEAAEKREREAMLRGGAEAAQVPKRLPGPLKKKHEIFWSYVLSWWNEDDGNVPEEHKEEIRKYNLNIKETEDDPAEITLRQFPAQEVYQLIGGLRDAYGRFADSGWPDEAKANSFLVALNTLVALIKRQGFTIGAVAPRDSKQYKLIYDCVNDARRFAQLKEDASQRLRDMGCEELPQTPRQSPERPRPSPTRTTSRPASPQRPRATPTRQSFGKDRPAPIDTRTRTPRSGASQEAFELSWPSPVQGSRMEKGYDPTYGKIVWARKCGGKMEGYRVCFNEGTDRHPCYSLVVGQSLGFTEVIRDSLKDKIISERPKAELLQMRQDEVKNILGVVQAASSKAPGEQRHRPPTYFLVDFKKGNWGDAWLTKSELMTVAGRVWVCGDPRQTHVTPREIEAFDKAERIQQNIDRCKRLGISPDTGRSLTGQETAAYPWLGRSSLEG